MKRPAVIENESLKLMENSIRPYAECYKIPNTSKESDLTVCHICDRGFSARATVPCQEAQCELRYCHSCLVKECKYSKKTARKLPTRTWKCPKCSHKCHCLK